MRDDDTDDDDTDDDEDDTEDDDDDEDEDDDDELLLLLLKPNGKGHKTPPRRAAVNETPLDCPVGFQGKGTGRAACVWASTLAKATSPANGPQPAISEIVLKRTPREGIRGLSRRSRIQVWEMLLL